MLVIKRLLTLPCILFWVVAGKAESIDQRNFALDTFSPTPNDVRVAEKRVQTYWNKHKAQYGANTRYLAVEAGATLLEGCEGQVMLTGTTAIPQPSFSTITDGTSATVQSDPVFVGGSVGANSMIFSPLRLSFKTKVSNQLFKQAARIFEPTLRDILSRGISSMLDNLALYGTGTNGQPLGVYSATTPVAITGSIAWADYKAALLGVMQTDLDPDSFGLITSPSFQNILDTELWTTGGVDSFWEKIANRYKDRMFVGNEISASSPGGAHATFFRPVEVFISDVMGLRRRGDLRQIQFSRHL
jgi:hypothetical protein